MPLKSLTNLDNRFGKAVLPNTDSFNPNGAWAWELEYAPLSLGTIDDYSEYLISLIELPLDLPAIRMVVRQINILWIVNESGEIVLALEELSPMDPLVPTTEDTGFLPRKLQFTKRPMKLGHPSLIGGKAGRIGGEIILERNEQGRFEWEINNKSGRYSTGLNRTEEQLFEVMREFKQRNVNLKVKHYDY